MLHGTPLMQAQMRSKSVSARFNLYPRIVAGIGMPQISAIDSVANALKDQIPLIADGGIRFSGDMAKAIGAGASYDYGRFILGRGLKKRQVKWNSSRSLL